MEVILNILLTSGPTDAQLLIPYMMLVCGLMGVCGVLVIAPFLLKNKDGGGE